MSPRRFRRSDDFILGFRVRKNITLYHVVLRFKANSRGSAEQNGTLRNANYSYRKYSFTSVKVQRYLISYSVFFFFSIGRGLARN